MNCEFFLMCIRCVSFCCMYNKCSIENAETNLRVFLYKSSSCIFNVFIFYSVQSHRHLKSIVPRQSEGHCDLMSSPAVWLVLNARLWIPMPPMLSAAEVHVSRVGKRGGARVLDSRPYTLLLHRFLPACSSSPTTKSSDLATHLLTSHPNTEIVQVGLPQKKRGL